MFSLTYLHFLITINIVHEISPAKTKTIGTDNLILIF